MERLGTRRSAARRGRGLGAARPRAWAARARGAAHPRSPRSPRPLAPPARRPGGRPGAARRRRGAAGRWSSACAASTAAARAALLARRRGDRGRARRAGRGTRRAARSWRRRRPRRSPSTARRRSAPVGGARRRGARRWSERIEGELADLGLGRARLAVAAGAPAARGQPARPRRRGGRVRRATGVDQVVFTLRAQPRRGAAAARPDRLRRRAVAHLSRPAARRAGEAEEARGRPWSSTRWTPASAAPRPRPSGSKLQRLAARRADPRRHPPAAGGEPRRPPLPGQQAGRAGAAPASRSRSSTPTAGSRRWPACSPAARSPTSRSPTPAS